MAASRQARRRLRGVALVSALALGAGCAPALKLDQAQTVPESYSEAHSGAGRQTDAQNLAQWWERFHDPLLTRLVSSALEHNYDVRLAVERVAQAQAGALGAFSRLFPSIGAGAKGTRYDGGDTDLVLLQPFGIDRLEFDRWQTGLQASWELDLFGQGRARLAAARELGKAAQADVQAVKLSVAASVADMYVNYRGLQKQQQLMLESQTIADEVMQIAERSFDAGVVQSTDIDLARADASQLRARLAELDAALAQLRLNLENLCVLPPGALTQELNQTAAMPVLPGPIAPGQPADLLLRRPDLVAAQARFEASWRQSDLARLNYLPRLSLGAVLGRSGIHTGGRSLGASGFWMADLVFALPLIDFGARKAEVQLADAQSRQAFLAFEQSARGALFDVERALATLDRIDRQAAARQQEVEHRNELMRKILAQYQIGDAGRLDMAQARADLLTSQASLARDQIRQFQAHIALYRAMGGGWADTPVSP